MKVQDIRGKLLNEGKTKRIWEAVGFPGLAVIESKDDITAGDGRKHDVIPGMGALCNETTCNVFKFLGNSGRKAIAWESMWSDTEFLAPVCEMLPLEVVVRYAAYGSYLKRHPKTHKGEVFAKPIVEFYLKTKDRRWKEHELPCDDPLIGPGIGVLPAFGLYDPAVPWPSHGFLLLQHEEIFRGPGGNTLFPLMGEHVLRASWLLRGEWMMLGCEMADIKVEFGIIRDPDNRFDKLVMADVITNHEWRLLKDGIHLDKQSYREGEPLDEVKRRYELVAKMTKRFSS